MEKLPSYPSLYNFGHKLVANILAHELIVEEKVDGSQFSFGVDLEGNLHMRSKNVALIPDGDNHMFNQAVASVQSVRELLIPGYTYRGEFLSKPKHNTLAYDRTPKNFIMIFDINTGLEAYLPYEEKLKEAERLGFECVPLVYKGKVESADQLLAFLDRVSALGGQKIEGVVLKPVNYDLFNTTDKKCIMAKYVSEAFKEIHQGDWKERNPAQKDVVELLITSLKTPARWNKAIQHLQERGELENSPKDIGKLMKEVPTDILKECESEIKEAMFKLVWPRISRGVVAGLPEYYKQHLVYDTFNKKGDNTNG